MSGLSNLQSIYNNSLKSLSRNTGRIIKDVKKDDELTARKSSTPTEDKGFSPPMFPITRNMLILSVLFWTTIAMLVYLCISYGTLYTKITQEDDLHKLCENKFGTREENFKIIEDYPLGDAGPYLNRLRPTKKEDHLMESKELPPIVTAIASDQFYQFQGLVKHLTEEIQTAHTDMKFIVYDLGLYKTEREIVEKYCNCQVREFRFTEYPYHVADTSNFSWRPILLQILLQEFGSIMYIEPTTRFKKSTSPNFLRNRGSKNYFLWDPPIVMSLIGYTDKAMFEFFKEERCLFIEGSILSSEAVVLYRTEVTWVELMKPWLKCALNAECISPKGAVFSGCFEIRHPRTTGCHRYDMSAASIILNRGVQYTIEREKMVSLRLTYSSDEEIKYFPEQPWTYRQIILLILTPVALIIMYKQLFRRRRLCRL